ncbi:MAG: DUF2752 domain-containing protein [Sedimentisphaerales bacterium]|nr:DUF2752 domain-containing protein [Sedimentisphaerales bacterium]
MKPQKSNPVRDKESEIPDGCQRQPVSNGTKWYIKSTKQDRISFLVVFGIIVLLSVVCWLVQQGIAGFGHDQSCAFERNYGLPCPTCGFTRAMRAFMRGRVLEAFYIQPGATGGALVLLWLAFFSLLSAVCGVNFSFLPPVRIWRLEYILMTGILILLGGWAVTLARALAKMS